MKPMSQKKLDSLCLQWQALLRLKDWNLTVRISPITRLGDDYVGCCSYQLSHKHAVIELTGEEDIEETLVHELLHLHFAPLGITDECGPRDVGQEQAINLIAEALIRLKRKAR